MTVGRRRPPPKPPKLGPPGIPEGLPEELRTLWEWGITTGSNLDKLWHYIQADYEGLPAPHGQQHSATGSDPITGATEDAEFLAIMTYLGSC